MSTTRANDRLRLYSIAISGKSDRDPADFRSIELTFDVLLRTRYSPTTALGREIYQVLSGSVWPVPVVRQDNEGYLRPYVEVTIHGQCEYWARAQILIEELANILQERGLRVDRWYSID